MNKKNNDSSNDNSNNNNVKKEENNEQEMDPDLFKDESELLEVEESFENMAEPNSRRNMNPYEIYNKLFKRTVKEIAVLACNRKFVASFNMHFIYKIYVGSWVHLNFFEISYQTNEMCEFYIRYKMGLVNARPLSDFNPKNGLKVEMFNNNFFKRYREMFGSLWKPVDKPMVTDTRYREDLLWLMRFYEITDNFPEGEKDPEKLDEYENIRLNAFLNAGKWKELLETFTRIKISKRLNK